MTRSILHHNKKVLGFYKPEIKVLEYFNKKVKEAEEGAAADSARKQSLCQIVRDVNGATPIEVVNATRALSKFDFLAECWSDTPNNGQMYELKDVHAAAAASDNKLMYKITDVGLAAYSKVKAEMQKNKTAAEKLKSIVSPLSSLVHASRK